MEGMAAMGFVFGMVGVVAFIRLIKLTKTLKRKRNSRRGLQGTVIHCLNLISHGGIILCATVYEQNE